MDPALCTLLIVYKHGFATLIGLQPTRSHDHGIPLLEGSNLVKVKQYRYPYSQKEQIKNMVAKMLQEGNHPPQHQSLLLSYPFGQEKGWYLALLHRL